MENIHFDENNDDKFVKAKKLSALDQSQRTVLSDLQNPLDLRAAGKKAQESSGAIKRKTESDDQPRKIFIQSDTRTLRNNARNTAVTGNVLQGHGLNTLMVGQNKGNILTTEAAENELLQSTALLEQKLKKPGAQLALRREGNILTIFKPSSATAEATNAADIKNEVASSTKGHIDEQDAKSAPQTYSTKTLNLVEDIDAADPDKLGMVTEYVDDIYNYLYKLESEQPIRENYLDDQLEVSPKMRSVLIDWLNEVHSHFCLATETFQMAVGMIDRYLQKVTDTERSMLQLVGVTALFFAAKYEESYSPVLSDLTDISDNEYSATQIRQMELKLFRTLDCNLSRPLPIHFLRRFTKAAKTDDLHYIMAKYLIELSLVEYSLAWYKPSEIAAASLFLTMHLLVYHERHPSCFIDKFWTPTLESYTRYNAKYLRPIAQKMAIVARNAPKARLKGVYNKFSSYRFRKVSMRPIYMVHEWIQ